MRIFKKIRVKHSFSILSCFLFSISMQPVKGDTISTVNYPFYTTETSYCLFACQTRYQQLYSSSYFSGQSLITEVNFFADNIGEWLGTSTWQISLSTSSKEIIKHTPGTFGSGGLSDYFQENIGSDVIVFDTQSFSGNVAFGQRVTFSGAFDYDPSLGNLLIDISLISGDTTRSFGMQARDDTNNGLIAANWGGGNECDSEGCLHLLTEFEVSAVPVPPAIWLFASGVLFLVGSSRKKQIIERDNESIKHDSVTPGIRRYG